MSSNDCKEKNACLVTGGGGFLGGAIVRLLVGERFPVTSFSRRFYPEMDALGVRQIQGDIRDPDAVDRAVEGARTVYHVAARTGVWGDYQDYHAVNVAGTANVVRACRNHRVPILIHTSSPSVVFNGSDMEGVDETVPYADTFDAPYPETKALAEQLALEAADESLAVIALRPHLIWGPGDTHLVPRILARARRLKRVGNGNNRVDTVYIDNAARAHLLAAKALEGDRSLSGNVYFISQGDPVLLWEMVDRFLGAGGLGPVTGSVSMDTAVRVGGLLERVYKVLRLRREPPMTRFVARELATSHWFDISRARKDLGYEPEISTGEGLKRLERWLETHGESGT